MTTNQSTTKPASKHPVHSGLITDSLLRLTSTVLTDALDVDGPTDAILSRFFRNNRELGVRERAFVAETVYGVLRRLRILMHITQGEDPRQLILALLLRVQGISLRDLEPVLNEQQVEWAHAIKAQSTDGIPTAVQVNVRDWFWEKLVAQYGEDEALNIARSLLEPATLDLRVNTVKANIDEVMQKFQAETSIGETGIAKTPYSPTGLRMPQRMSISRHILFTEGHIEVQDEGSQILAHLVGVKRGMMVADFCAGAGGKSLAIGALMRNTGRIYAYDVSDRRLQNLGKRLKRSGLSNLNAQVINSENDSKLKRLNGKFDRVLVDAPCSGMGTLRRNPDLKWRQTPDDVAELVQKQTNILARCAKLVKPGGRLVYATCSLLSDENEQVAEAFLTANPDYALVPANQILSHQNIDLDTGDYLKLLPHIHQTDGFFAAIFEKTKPVDDKKKTDKKATPKETTEVQDTPKAKVKPKAKTKAKPKEKTK